MNARTLTHVSPSHLLAKHFHRSRDSRFFTRAEGRPRNFVRELAWFSCSSTVTYVIRLCRWKFDVRDEKSSRSGEFRNDIVECHPLRNENILLDVTFVTRIRLEKSNVWKKYVFCLKEEKKKILSRNLAKDPQACDISILQKYLQKFAKIYRVWKICKI